jgi:4-amino-4-deoxy-L-arabinose transferase-like glycosyltransferase
MLRAPRQTAILLAALASLIGAVRIGSTWRIFNETTDEAYHIACGMQWLSVGRYTYETQHPPLARIVAALGPYWSGAKFHNMSSGIDEEHLTLNAAPDYFGVLTRARAGNLLFFFLGCASVWLLARRCGGTIVAAVSVGLFTLIPVVLGHAGLATTDMALAACLTLAFWGWQHWLDRPGDPQRAALAGLATGLAMVSKFSSVLFLPAMLVPVLAWRWWRKDLQVGPRLGLWKAMACAAGVFFFVCWSVYRFDLTPARFPPGRPFLLLDATIGETGWVHNVAYWLLDLHVPLAAMIRGIGEVYQHNWDGHNAYLLGHLSQQGWWYFFPIVLAVKTPIALAILAIAGAVVAFRERNRPAAECLMAATAIVLVSMASNVNLGVRHVLPVYLLMAVPAGLAVVRLWKRTWMIAALCVWLVAASVAAHPDYFAYFNILAMGKPERIVVDSDLDWGQDLHRATLMLQARGVREAWIAYNGKAKIARETGIVYHEYPYSVRVHGWLVVSMRMLYFEGAIVQASGRPDPYVWLKNLPPTMRAGRSILIFDLK